MLLLKRFNYYIIVLLFFTQLGCSSHKNNNNQDYPDSIIYDEDLGFCGYISCVDNHNVVQYKLPCHKDFPNQNKYDSILIEIMGYADWKISNDRILFLQKAPGRTNINMFCYKGNEWDTVFIYYHLDDVQDIIVKHSLDTIYEMAYPYMKQGVFYLYSCRYDHEKLSLNNLEDLYSSYNYREPGIAKTEYQYKIRLTK